MKTRSLIATCSFIILSTALASRAADPVAGSEPVAAPVTAPANSRNWWDDRAYYSQENVGLFNANELTLDLFGSYLGRERHFTDFPDHSIRRGTWGGGVGANYFWTREVGIGVDTSFQDGGRRFVDHVSGSLIVRLPIETVHLAPYVFGGAGYEFEPVYEWSAHLGGGLEFRFNPKTAVFADARYIWSDRTGDQCLVRAGFRLAF